MTPTTENDQMRIAEARHSFTGKNLSDSQFDESWALTEIMHRGIRKTGSFYEKLEDYSHAFARAENFNQMKGKVIIRDQFKSRYGQTMNDMREELKAREASLPETTHRDALEYARMIEPLIRDGKTMPFYRAYDYTGGALAEKLNISEVGAKELMKTAYRESEGRELYDTGKVLEKQFHEPVREAERAARQTNPRQTRKPSYQR